MRFLLGLTRTLIALSLGLWIGGLTFFGAITAAIMFRMTKAIFHNTRDAAIAEIAPRMVGPMLSRFAIVCAVCSVILVVGWLVDGWLTKRALWWRLQGALTVIAVGLGTYLNFGLLPTVERDQDAALPLYVRSLDANPIYSPAETEVKARFDDRHQRFDSLASVNIYLLVGVLACLMARSLPDKVGLREAE